jgi:hypothetical protein
MAITKLPIDDVSEALEVMVGLATDRNYVVFRGHLHDKYFLSSSFAREYDQSHFDFLQYDIVELINRYKVALKRAGLAPFESTNLFDWMEYGRHYGLPTPSIDFTYSAYIGLFFAFDGAGESRLRMPVADDRVAIYALDLQVLGNELAKAPNNPVSGPPAWWLGVLNAAPNLFPVANTSVTDDVVARARGFLEPDYSKFERTIPLRTIQAVPFPGSKVERIHRQQGLLIYDTLHYKKGKCFEDLLIACPNDEENRPVAFKYTLPVASARIAWGMLSAMGITASSMYMDTAATVRDAMQQRYYLTNLAYLRDDDRFEAYDDFEPPN